MVSLSMPNNFASINKPPMKYHIFSSLAIATLLITGCENDDDSNPSINLEIPAEYTFERNGESTVSFGGQTTRINMAEAILDDLKEFDNEQVLLNRFANENDAFDDAELNSSSKSIKSKIAASADYFANNASTSAQIRSEFENWLSSQVTVVGPNENTAAAPGVPGQIADGSSTRYVDGRGIEYDQLFAKGLLGALMTDQTLNNYLSISVLDEGDNRSGNEQEITAEGKSYTIMEHKWDEAYGYVFGAAQNTADPLATIGDDDSFFSKYISRVENDPSFSGIALDIYNAFKTGRAAIVAGDYDIRDQQANLIREHLSEVIGVRAVYYLKSGEAAIAAGDMGAAFHDLSEGYGFIYSLQFTRVPGTEQPYLSRTEVQTILDDMLNDGMNGLWDVETSTLSDLADQIADKFDFTVEQAADSNN